MLLDFLDKLETGTTLYLTYLEFVDMLGSSFSQNDTESTMLYMENSGLELLAEFSKENPHKNDAIVVMITSFTSEDEGIRLRILTRLEKVLKKDLKIISGILAHLVEQQSFSNFEEGLFRFYLDNAENVIQSSYPKMKVNGLKIINELSKQNLSEIFSLFGLLQELAEERWWEIQAQILIICCNQLDFIESQFNPENDSQ